MRLGAQSAASVEAALEVSDALSVAIALTGAGLKRYRRYRRDERTQTVFHQTQSAVTCAVSVRTARRVTFQAIQQQPGNVTSRFLGILIFGDFRWILMTFLGILQDF